jgi:hypothetical protein
VICQEPGAALRGSLGCGPGGPRGPRASTCGKGRDAEKRLIQVERGGPPGEGDEKVEFAYDYLSRRVEKKVSTWNVNLNPPDWEVTLKRRFVWAGGGTGGWLMLMELDGLNSNAVVRQYTWGLDLAGQSGVASGGPAGRLGAGMLGSATGILDDPVGRQN